MPCIPVKSLTVVDQRIFTLYDTLIIEIHELYDSKEPNVNKITCETKEQRTCFYGDFLNDEFEIRWGNVWHVGLINEVKKRPVGFYYHHLAFHLHTLIGKSLLEKIFRIFTHPLYLLLSKKIVLTAVFWCKNLINAKQLCQVVKSGTSSKVWNKAAQHCQAEIFMINPLQIMLFMA